MRRPSLTPLGETEMEVLRHVWTLGEATVADVRGRMLAERDVAYTTVMTVLKNLTEKGYLTYRQDGRTYVYRAARRPQDVRGSLLGDLLDKVFDGSPSALVQALVRRERDLPPDERAAIRDLLAAFDAPDDAGPDASPRASFDDDAPDDDADLSA
jgi:predicted transcriptional regulator